MNFKILLAITIGLLPLFVKPAMAQKGTPAKATGIILEIEFDKNFNKPVSDLKSSAYDDVVQRIWKPITPEIEANRAKWLVVNSGPVWIDLSSILGSKLNLYEPGDSIHIDLRDGTPVYSGRNSDKFKMLQELKESRSLLKGPNISGFNADKPDAGLYTVASVKDYQEWSLFFDDHLKLIEQIFQSYQDKISTFAFGYLKADLVSEVEYERLRKFSELRNQSSMLNISRETLVRLFDSTAYNKSVKWLHSYKGKTRSYYYYYDFVRKSVERNYNFNSEHELFQTAARKVAYADLAKKIYQGDMLQGFFVYLLTERGLKEHTLKSVTPEIELLLNEFYAMPGHPEYKAYVKIYEAMIREWVIGIGHTAPDFNLKDIRGISFTKESFKGKLALLNFVDDSQESAEMTAALEKVHQKFQKNDEVVLVNTYCGTNEKKWDLQNQNESKSIINLYANQQGEPHAILKYYNVKPYPDFNVKAYPKVFLLDAQGKFVYNGEFGKENGGLLERRNNTFPDPRKDNAMGLISEINKQLALGKDGPYVFHENKGVTAYHIQSSKVVKQQYPVNSSVKLISQTDDFQKTFPVHLKSKLILESSETTARPEKLFVLSDIEGEFEAFRKLLQANKVIDEQFNWTFGKGHLVFAGDMFDRGEQVTECLWLVYTLEEKAKFAGGYIHFILGNHEIMNLQGDHRYVEDKYKENAKLIGKTLTQLYNENSELGRWLRTKNIVEKIGDLLFTHGGISAEMTRLNLPIDEINKLARPNYANRQDDYKDTNTNTIMSSKIGPFWYRGFYDPRSKATEASVDSTLQKLNVKHIVTGHTIVADTISIHYGGKVINTDTKHARGKSEALLIEGSNFYRINAEGNRVLLFRDEEK